MTPISFTPLSSRLQPHCILRFCRCLFLLKSRPQSPPCPPSDISHPWYAPASARANVTGQIVIADGRPSGHLWVLVSTQSNDQVYDIHEPSYYVLTKSYGSFTVPGVPPGNYSLHVYAASGSITDTLNTSNVVVSGTTPVVNVGVVTWTPDDNSLKLQWQTDRYRRSNWGRFRSDSTASLGLGGTNPRHLELHHREHL
jgi:hypothetical protein